MRPASVVAAIRRMVLFLGASALAGALVAGLALPLAAGVGIAARSGAEAFRDLPAELSTQPLAQRTRVLDADGRLLALWFDENRIDVPLEKVSPVMQQAILAVEDARFYEHGPIDLRGTLRAFVANLESGEVSQGGSTLTQQYVKRVLVDQAETPEEVKEATEPSYARKVRELRLAVTAEKQFTKDEILERYLNIAYFGGGAYGVEAAARYYFSTTSDKLTVTQSALLAGLLQAPSSYDPEKYPERALARRNVVLTRMADVGMISQAEAAKARQEPLGLNVSEAGNGCYDSYAPFFCDYVFRELMLMPELGATPEERERTIRRGGLTITTTIDKKSQDAAQKAISEKAAPTDRAVAAMAMVEPGTGAIKAMAQSRLYGKGKGRTFVNYTANASHGQSNGFQPGSTFKVWVLAAAIKQGIPLATELNSPPRIDMRNQKFKTCDGTVRDPKYQPRNYSESASGRFNMAEATWLSVNTYFIQLEQRTGICDAARIAEASGVKRADGGDLQQVPSFVLGVNEVSPLAMAEGYAMFANRGVHCPATAVTEIIDRHGNPIEFAKPECNRVLEEKVADKVNYVLQGVIDGPNSRRTGARMTLGRPAAGKTGTTNDAKHIWFAGYTPQLSAAVVVGDTEAPLRSMHGVTLNGTKYRTACGGCIPGPIWKEAMQGALKGVEPKSFAKADLSDEPQVTRTRVPDVRGLTPDDAIRVLEEAGFEAYVAGRVDSRLDRGLVVSTSPRAGTTHRSGGTVRIYISSGNRPNSDNNTDQDNDQGANRGRPRPTPNAEEIIEQVMEEWTSEG